MTNYKVLIIITILNIQGIYEKFFYIYWACHKAHFLLNKRTSRKKIIIKFRAILSKKHLENNPDFFTGVKSVC